MLDHLGVRGFTQWDNIVGRGSQDGRPHMGTHTWPEQNGAVITIVEEEKVDQILEAVDKIDAVNREVGIRAFVWDVEKMSRIKD